MDCLMIANATSYVIQLLKLSLSMLVTNVADDLHSLNLPTANTSTRWMTAGTDTSHAQYIIREGDQKLYVFQN